MSVGGGMRVKALGMLIVCAVVTAVGVNCHSAQNKETLGNETIMRMVKAGLGEDVIISKIKDSKTNFDLSTDGLIELKGGGVSDAVISAMQNPSAGQRLAQPARGKPAASSAELMIVQDGKNEEMEYVAGIVHVRSHGFGLFSSGKTRYLIMASGEHASLKITGTRPVFMTTLHPSELSLVKFDTDTYNNKVVRYVQRVGGIWRAGGSAADTGEGSVDIDFKKEGDGRYRFSAKEPLEQGEYGIITEKGDQPKAVLGGSSSYRIYDFAVGR